jgi:hypothetical protein
VVADVVRSQNSTVKFDSAGIHALLLLVVEPAARERLLRTVH